MKFLRIDRTTRELQVEKLRALGPAHSVESDATVFKRHSEDRLTVDAESLEQWPQRNASNTSMDAVPDARSGIRMLK